jgi:hypothetical protein
MEDMRSASKRNTIPDKQHDLLNRKAENNTFIMPVTYKINPTIECWLCGTTENKSLSLTPVFLNRRAAARYRALASIVPAARGPFYSEYYKFLVIRMGYVNGICQWDMSMGCQWDVNGMSMKISKN